MTKATENSTPTVTPTTPVVTTSSALTLTTPPDLALTVNVTTLVLSTLYCLVSLVFNNGCLENLLVTKIFR